MTIEELVFQNDEKNLKAISDAVKNGTINAEAGDYLTRLYSDGMVKFRQIFNVLGKLLGAPKAAVYEYDYETNLAADRDIKISDINPMRPYMVNHRLDMDPMRNQFFTMNDNKINLLVSSIVSVIVGAEKSISRTLEKISGKYYSDYVNDVAIAAHDVIAANGRDASADAIAEKIREKFSEKFITNASETVLAIIGRGYEKIAVELVRSLDKITKPHLRLQDVWRVKCLFDMVPQARTFIERIREMLPDDIIKIKDKFYEVDNPRNYRDTKIVLNIGQNGDIIPLEIICQVRTLFEFENKNHDEYERVRSSRGPKDKIESVMARFYEQGIVKYNDMICGCLDDLFDRVGWNILYGKTSDEESMFEGFPRNISHQYYPPKIVDTILDKLENAVENEVFRVPDAPAKLNMTQEISIFRWLAKFVLVSAMPYKFDGWKVSCIGISEKLFTFVMKELGRHYKK